MYEENSYFSVQTEIDFLKNNYIYDTFFIFLICDSLIIRWRLEL